MELVIENDIRETTVRKAAFVITGIPNTATHIKFTGDLDFVFSDPANLVPILDIVELVKRPLTLTGGNLLLSRGDGLKYITIQSMYRAITQLLGGVSSTILGPPAEYLFLPASQDHVSSELVGHDVVFSGGVATITGIKDVAGTLYYILSSDPGITAVDPYWFTADFFIGSEACDTITLIEEPVAPTPDPDASLDVEEFWGSVRSFYRELGTEDKLLIEGVWQGLAHNWGNLMQRLYELDAQQNIFDMFVYRREHWVFTDTSLRRYSNTGYTDRSTPDRFYDDSRPFVAPFTFREDVDDSDVGKYLTVGGKSYRVEHVVNSREVILEGAKFSTDKQLSYTVGGQHEDDLSAANQFSKHVSRTHEAVLDSTLPTGIGLTDIDYAECADFPNGGRVRLARINYEGGSTLAANPDRLYWTQPVFTHAYKGTRVVLGGTTYRVIGFDPDGYWLQLQGAAFGDATGLKFKFIETDFSSFTTGSFSAGSKTFTDTSGENPFVAGDVGSSVIVQGGANAGVHKIARFISASSVELDYEAVANESNVSWQIAADIVVDLIAGEVQRVPFGRYPDCATAKVKCFIRVKYRVKANDRLVSLPYLQEWLELPRDEQFTTEEITIGNDNYLLHKNITDLKLTKSTGMSLMHGIHYTYDADTGILTPLSQLISGDKVFAEITFQPWFGKEAEDYFLESDKYIYFRENPRVRLFGESGYYNHEDPYKEYGHLIDFYQENSEQYYFSLMAIWIAHWMGPRPGFKQRAINILLGLPFAQEDGEVTSLSERRVGAVTRWVITIDYEEAGSTQIVLPPDLEPYVGVGEKVKRFDILSGFVYEYRNAGTLRGRVINDQFNNPFDQSHVDGKLWVLAGDNKGVYRITKFIQASQIATDGDFIAGGDVSYKILLPAIRIYDKVNHPGWLTKFATVDILEKYYTQNTTPAEKLIAQQIMEEHLFMLHIPGDVMAVSDENAIPFINSFLYDIKATYTDFIFQIFKGFTDEFAFDDGGDIYPDFLIDLTSTYGWFAGTLPSQVDPFTGTVDLHGYPSYIGGEAVSPFIFEDTNNAPFSIDDVGRKLVVPAGWRVYANGAVNPSNPKRFYSASPALVFQASDVGKELYLPSLGGSPVLVTIEAVVSPYEVIISGAVFSALAIGLEFHVAHEVNQGVYEITGYVSPSRVLISPGMVPGSGIFYQVLDEEYWLDDETLNFYSEGYVDLYDGGGTFIKRVML